MKKWMGMLTLCLTVAGIGWAQEQYDRDPHQNDNYGYNSPVTNIERAQEGFSRDPHDNDDYSYNGVDQELTQIFRQVRMLERVTDVPLEYTANREDGTPLSKDLYNLAKKTYEKNPRSFNAAYNYGILTYTIVAMEIGNVATDAELEQAYNIFEGAKKLRPNDIVIYEQQDQIIHYKLFGNDVPFRMQTDDEIVQIYKQHTQDAKRRLAAIRKIFEIRQIGADRGVPADLRARAEEAFLICLALGQQDAAYKWLELLGGPREWHTDTTSIAPEYRAKDPYWRAVRKQYREALKQVYSDWHINHHPAAK